MKLNTDGLILRSKKTGESNRLVTVLTRDLGVVYAFANGAAKVSGKSSNATETLCYSTFSLSENKGTYTLSEAAPIEMFFDLRSDIERLSLAQYFCELVMNLAVEGEDASELLRLTLNSLYLLSNNLRAPRFIKAVFELRIMSTAGFMPDLSCCSECGAQDISEPVFNINDGVVYCSGCGNGVAIGRGVLAAMRHICTCDFLRIFSFEIGDESLKKLSEICERYVVAHCSRRFTALDFYNNLPR